MNLGMSVLITRNSDAHSKLTAAVFKLQSNKQEQHLLRKAHTQEKPKGFKELYAIFFYFFAKMFNYQ